MLDLLKWTFFIKFSSKLATPSTPCVQTIVHICCSDDNNKKFPITLQILTYCQLSLTIKTKHWFSFLLVQTAQDRAMKCNVLSLVPPSFVFYQNDPLLPLIHWASLQNPNDPKPAATQRRVSVRISTGSRAAVVELQEETIVPGSVWQCCIYADVLLTVYYSLCCWFCFYSCVLCPTVQSKKKKSIFYICDLL